MIKVYFAEENYRLIYLHRFFFYIGVTGLEMFSGAYLLSLGMKLHWVLLFYGLLFGLRGVLCPSGIILTNKIGALKALWISSALAAVFMAAMSFAHLNLWIGFSSFIFLSLASAIFTPTTKMIEAILVKDDTHRGRQYTMSMIAKGLGKASGAILIGPVIAYYSYSFAAPIIFISLILGILPFIYFQKKFAYIPDLKTHEVWHFNFSKHFRPYIKILWMLQFGFICNGVMISLFIYLLLGKIDQFGYLMASAFILEKIITLLAGIHIDNKGDIDTLQKTKWINILSIGLFASIVNGPLSAFLAETFNKISWKTFTAAFNTTINRMARKDEKMIFLFSACWEIIVCSCELATYSVFAIVAFFFPKSVFLLSFMLAIFGILVSSRMIANLDKQQKNPY